VVDCRRGLICLVHGIYKAFTGQVLPSHRHTTTAAAGDLRSHGSIRRIQRLRCLLGYCALWESYPLYRQLH
jgi:hypothetical protein